MKKHIAVKATEDGVVPYIPSRDIRLELVLIKVQLKRVKESRNGPGVTQRVPGGLGSQISMTFGT